MDKWRFFSAAKDESLLIKKRYWRKEMVRLLEETDSWKELDRKVVYEKCI
jgi:hypothetical protein